MTYKVSVIYVNYNTSELLIGSILSIKKHCSEIYEIFIVDNNSDDEQKTILTSWLAANEYNNVRIIFSDSNAGFAKANNLAASHSRAKYLLFLNPDTIVLSDVVKLFYDFLESQEPAVVACGGNLLSIDQKPVNSYGNFPSLLQEICEIGLGLSWLLGKYHSKKIAIGTTVELEEIFEVSYIVGADIFIRTECFLKMGGFDENYFMYYEETDLFYRLRKAGYKSFILPQVKIIHLEGGAIGLASKKEFNIRKFEMILKSKLYYFNKTKSTGYGLIKSVSFIQIVVQFIKGKMGRDLKPLLGIYSTNVQEKRF